MLIKCSSNSKPKKRDSSGERAGRLSLTRKRLLPNSESNSSLKSNVEFQSCYDEAASTANACACKSSLDGGEGE